MKSLILLLETLDYGYDQDVLDETRGVLKSYFARELITYDTYNRMLRHLAKMESDNA